MNNKRGGDIQDATAKKIDWMVNEGLKKNKSKDELGKMWDTFYNNQAHEWADYGSNWGSYGKEKEDPKSKQQGEGKKQEGYYDW